MADSNTSQPHLILNHELAQHLYYITKLNCKDSNVTKHSICHWKLAVCIRPGNQSQSRKSWAGKCL